MQLPTEQMLEKARLAFAEVEAIITGSHFVYTSGNHGSDYVNKDRVYVYPVIVKRLCKMFAECFLNDNIQVVAGPTVGGVSLAHLTAIEMSEMGEHLIQAVFADEEENLETIEIKDPLRGDNEEEHIRLVGAKLSETELEELMCISGLREVIGITNKETDETIVKFVKCVGKKRILKRGYDAIVKGKKVLLVEDIINTGITIIRLREAVEAAGGEVYAVACLCNRSGGKVTAETLGVPILVSLLNLDMKMHPEDNCPICKEKGIESIRLDLGKGRDYMKKIGRSDLL